MAVYIVFMKATVEVVSIKTGNFSSMTNRLVRPLLLCHLCSSTFFPIHWNPLSHYFSEFAFDMYITQNIKCIHSVD
jgi:hypothetical protein